MKPEHPLSDRRGTAAPSRRAGRASVLLLASWVAACGGGGGGDAAPAPAPPSGGTALSCPAPVATTTAALTPATPSAAPAPTGAFVITGTATYDFVPTRSSGRGLDYAGITQKPIRGATVQLLDGGGQPLATTATDELGRYGFGLASAQAVTVRVRAEIKRSGGGDRDFTVRDNTSGEALYVLDSPAFTPAAGTTPQNLNALSGWGGSSYTGTRAAGPFAILDVVYAAQAKVATAEPTVALAPLKLFWSPNNRPVSGDLTVGNIGTSFFRLAGSDRALYLLGAENNDTDEYDSHVVAHEFGHYLQSALSRDDSVGGPHSLGDRLDMRVAFSEGWGNAWSGMVLGSPVYSDSNNAGQASGFFLDVSQPGQGADRGWYAESSAQYLLWSVHQDAAIGFGPVYAALRSLAAAPTFSSLYSFAAQLKAAVPAATSGITSLWAGQQIAAQDNCGTGETNAGGNAANLPVYKQHTAALGVAQNYCVDTTADSQSDGNKLGRYVYILFSASGTRTLTATRSGGNFSAGSDPDLLLLKSDGSKIVANAEIEPTQSLTTALPTGTHVLALEDYNLTSPSTSCFNLTVN